MLKEAFEAENTNIIDSILNGIKNTQLDTETHSIFSAVSNCVLFADYEEAANPMKSLR